MNLTTLRLRYSQLFIICLLGISLYIMTQNMPGGISQFENNFWNREFLLTSFTRLKLALGDRVFPQALIGKAGWLEYTGDGDLDIYQDAGSTSEESLKATQQKLQKLYDVLHARDITFILVIPPNKASIYPDTLPDEIEKPGKPSKLDLFTAYIQKHGPPILVDLRQPLRDGRKKQDVYYKTDTHWNDYGAFIAYTEIMKTLSQTYPQLAPKSMDDFQINIGKPSLHDISKYISANNLVESEIAFTPKDTESEVSWLTLNNDWIIPMQIATTPNKNLPTALMYMDSFGWGLQKFVAPHFQKTTFILNHSTYPDAISLEAIDAVHPDVVVVEFLERFFTIKKMDAFLNKLVPEKK